MPPAIIAGVVAGAASIGGAVLTSKSNKKAVKTATTAQQQSEAQQLAYQREADARNYAALSPWMTRGNQAGDAYMAALGFGGGFHGGPDTAMVAAPPPGALTVPYSGAYADASGYNPEGRGFFSSMPVEGPMMDGGGGWGPSPQGGALTAQVAPQGSNPQQAALSAYEIFKQSTGYQSRLQEGNRSLASNYFGGGVGQSGAAVKAALRYGQNFASNEFGNWMGALGGVSGQGLGAASAVAGVSQGSADRMGAISQNSADFATQAAIARAQSQGALYTGIAGAAGQVAGSLSSYKPRIYG